MISDERFEQALSAAETDIDSAVELLDSAHKWLHALSVLVEKSASGVVVPDDLEHEPQTVSSD